LLLLAIGAVVLAILWRPLEVRVRARVLKLGAIDALGACIHPRKGVP
jgi:hypothetical protein